jgi:hypothetical protein
MFLGRVAIRGGRLARLSLGYGGAAFPQDGSGEHVVCFDGSRANGLHRRKIRDGTCLSAARWNKWLTPSRASSRLAGSRTSPIGK